MIVVVAYDVSDSRRRRRLATALSAVGWRLQESVFQCILDGETAAEFNEELARQIDQRTDTVHVFRLCRPCYATSAASHGDRPPVIDTHWTA
jgi:CRISPR-associated protein Cas2